MQSIQHVILNKVQIEQKIIRIAWEIYERNFGEKELVLVGIAWEGYEFALKLQGLLTEISQMEVGLVKLQFNKHAESLPSIIADLPFQNLENKVIVLTDDVLNTGRTISYALSAFLSIPIRKIQVAVIVDRNHRLFPIRADYIGHALSTTINEHVTVKIDSSGAHEVILS